MTNHETRPSVHIQRTASNMTQERIGRLALRVRQLGITGVRLSSHEHMYATIMGARALAEYYDNQGLNLAEEINTEGDSNLRHRVDAALHKTRSAKLEVPSLPADIYSIRTMRGNDYHVLAVGVSGVIGQEIAATRKAIGLHYQWPQQHNGLRIAGSSKLKNVRALGRLLSLERSLLPEYIIYEPITMPDVAIRFR